MSGLDDLYQEVILDHYRRPRNRGHLDAADRTVELVNPLCGDDVTVAIRLDGERLADVRFTGDGCSISIASASMMTDAVSGRTLAEARTAVDAFKRFMRGEGEAGGDGGGEGGPESIGEARALSGVLQFPVRVRCATLAWNALEMALEGKSGRAVVTE